MFEFFTEEQIMFRDTARKYAQNDVEPLAQQIDRDDKVPQSLIAKAKELSFFGLYTPEEYGGLGMSLVNSCIVLEEIAKASPALAGLLNVEIVLCPSTVNKLGTEEQKQRILTQSAAGDKLLAWSMSEPSGATDLHSHQTRIVADGNGYLVNGSKLFCTQGTADYILVWAASIKDGKKGYGCAVVETNQQGVLVAPYESKLGWRGTNTGSLAFDDVFVTPENILGDLFIAQEQLGEEVNQASFIGHAVTSLGCAEGLFDKTVAYVNDRKLYGQPMHRLQPVAYWLGKARANIEAARTLCYAAARAYDEGKPEPMSGSLCKAWVCDTMFEVSSNLLQLWGGSGMMDSTGVNRYFRDARANMVAEAASEFHYDMLASGTLGINPAMVYTPANA